MVAKKRQTGALKPVPGTNAPAWVFSACQSPASLGPLEWNKLPEVPSSSSSFSLFQSPLSVKPLRCRLAWCRHASAAHSFRAQERTALGPSGLAQLFEGMGAFLSPFTSHLFSASFPLQHPLRGSSRSLLPLPLCHSAAWFPCAGVLRAPTLLLLPCPLPCPLHHLLSEF